LLIKVDIMHSIDNLVIPHFGFCWRTSVAREIKLKPAFGAAQQRNLWFAKVLMMTLILANGF
jgi:hypothetical protein